MFRSLPREHLARTLIELCSDGGEYIGRVHTQISALWEVLTKQPVGVLVQPALPGARVMSRDIADRFGQDIADTNRGVARTVGQCLDIGERCRW
jgi:hypothetical protein